MPIHKKQGFEPTAVADKTDWAIFVEDNPKDSAGAYVKSRKFKQSTTRDGRIVNSEKGSHILLFRKLQTRG